MFVKSHSAFSGPGNLKIYYGSWRPWVWTHLHKWPGLYSPSVSLDNISHSCRHWIDQFIDPANRDTVPFLEDSGFQAIEITKTSLLHLFFKEKKHIPCNIEVRGAWRGIYDFIVFFPKIWDCELPSICFFWDEIAFNENIQLLISDRLFNRSVKCEWLSWWWIDWIILRLKNKWVSLVEPDNCPKLEPIAASSLFILPTVVTKLLILAGISPRL